MSSPTPNVAEKLESVAAILNDAAKGLRAGAKATPEQHAVLIEALKSTVELVNEPRDDISDVMTAFAQGTIIRLFIKWQVFANIPLDGAIPYKDLAVKVAGDVALISENIPRSQQARLCWVLVSTGVLRQEGSDQIAHTIRSRAYGHRNPLQAMMQMGFDEYLPPLLALPRYYETYGIKEPTEKLYTVKAFAEGKPGQSVADITLADPERVATFVLAMDSMENMYPHDGMYNYSWVAARAGESPDRALIVDVGGAQGNALQAMCKSTPGLPMSRCVLQDLPEVIETVKKIGDEGIKGARLMSMDFHNEQPVKGALVYHIRRCLHDFGDDESVQILQHLSDAMAPDSRVLIGEAVMDNPPARSVALVDFLLSTVGGKERTVDGFREIASRAGLKVRAVHQGKQRGMSIVECEKEI
ncbi:S-adenosyl-L-methionine-dependent methyltransferase [Venustampulla echinocandica]|uniref:S-adenosyl-L-methionine-dependent methyltransferase n=1 Tax=Venustampulla echinocandica TaxID=2656787 RepID=A0A370TE28_9HELO|nr:S-adenosyl-L-methionine-dependent methyltransferase [Venustampulla echinocandica]RDL32697.1 S-adenosyl-L-methionine-dependent methyltransferase [Venustampulla echinocandica]